MPRLLMARRRSRSASIGILVYLAGSLAGCGREKPPSAPIAAKPAPVRTETTYELKGEVLGLDAKNGMIRIHHEAIPEFMPAMRMSFTLKDPRELESLKVGDIVQGSLWVVREKGIVTEYALGDLAVVSRPLTLKVEGGEASLAGLPKRLEPGEVVPDFAMTTQDGTPLKLSDLRGKVVALTFIYTRCPLPDACPLLSRKFSEVADRLSTAPGRAERMRLLSVSFDPEHDTPEVLKKYATIQGAKPPLWTFAVASHAELARVAPGLGLSYGPRSDDIMHNLTAVVIDAEGRLVKIESGKSWTPTDLFKTIYSQIPVPRE
jgi:protein SCO1/2